MGRVWLSVLLGDVRRNLASIVRRLILTTIVAAGAFFFGVSLPALNYRLTAAFQYAEYDVRIRSDAGVADMEPAYEWLRRNRASTATVFEASLETAAGTKSAEALEAVFYRPGEWESVGRTFFSPRLVTAGRPSAGFAGLDRLTAGRLGVGVGDRVTYSMRVSDARGVRRVTGGARVHVLYAATDQTRGLVLPLPQGLGDVGAPGGPALTAHVFAAVKGRPEHAAASLAALSYDGQPVIETLPEGFRRGQRAFERSVDRNVRFSLTWLGVALFAAFVLRDLDARVRRRSKALAIVMSLGAERVALAKMLAGEQAVLAFLSAAGGVAIGRILLEGPGELFVPLEILVPFASYVVIAVVLVLGIATWALRQRLTALCIAELLATP